MPLVRAQLASCPVRIAAVALFAAALTGCQGISGIQPASQVRVIDASPDAPALDIYQSSSSQGSAASLYNVGFGAVSSYMQVAPGAYTHSATTAGTQQQLASVRGTFAAGAQYTVLTGNVAAGLQMSVLRDQSTPAPYGHASLRVLDEATRGGAVDLYLVPAGASLAHLTPFLASATFGATTGYVNAPAGTYSIVAYPAGSVPAAAVPEYTGSQITYPSGSARTLILLDQPAIPRGLQVITAVDYDPANS